MTENTEFDQAFLRVLPRLYSRLAVLQGSRDLADDLVQDVYVRLKTRPSRVNRFVAHPNPYGYALATALNLRRGQWRSTRPVVSLEQTAQPGHDGGIPATDSWHSVTQLLRALTGKEAAVVLLVDLDGYTLAEAASLLGVHKGTAARNRLRALTKLRTLLSASPRELDQARKG